MITTTLHLPNVHLYVAIAGPEQGPAVILLHGFPDAWFGWEKQVISLAEKGYRVIVPNQRGYANSAQPQSVDNYSLKLLADDIIALADYLDLATFYLAGHDFGGMVAWTLAAQYPHRIKKLAILSAPHLTASWEYNKIHWQQKLKSWYILFFQLRVVPEFILKSFNCRALIRNLPADLTPAQKNRYRTAWQQKKVLSTMLHWYRALLKDLKNKQLKGCKIDIDTLIIWGARDKYLHQDLAALSLKQCTKGQLVLFEDSGHWLMHYKETAISTLLIEHFTL